MLNFRHDFWVEWKYQGKILENEYNSISDVVKIWVDCHMGGGRVGQEATWAKLANKYK